ncbi:MAG: GTP-binding protein [Pseudomonadota bacterium]
MGADGLPPVLHADRGVLRLLTCGSVDDGKSTLIGRLLYDTRSLLADTLATLVAHAARRGLAAPDLALLTDGLTAEREQGITIDVAYRYFSTGRRKFIIADAPGHVQYTRNMVTAASTADLALLLVDARHGIVEQTRRHAAIATLLGVRTLVLAVNKMDLVGWSEPAYHHVVDTFHRWNEAQPATGRSARPGVIALPLCALDGDGVVDPGVRMPWYTGPTLVDVLETAPALVQYDASAPLRLPVQWVGRPGGDGRRTYCGRIEGGTLCAGQQVAILPGTQCATVASLTIGARHLEHALAGQSVAVTLDRELGIARGDLLVAAGSAGRPREVRDFDATVCWLSRTSLQPARTYRLQHGTRELRCRVGAIDGVLDLQRLDWRDAAGTVATNEIAMISVRVEQALFADAYDQSRSTGSFIMIDDTTRETVAAGLLS